MKRLAALPLLGLALLSACNNQSPPAPNHTGVWTWALIDANESIVDQGTIVLNTDLKVDTGVVYAGYYFNAATTRNGLGLMGPISAANNLEVFLTADLNSEAVNVYMVGQDLDNKLETVNGKAVFEGAGAITDTAGNPIEAVGVVFIQESTTVPGAAALSVLKAQSMNSVRQYLLNGGTVQTGHQPNIPALQSAASVILK